MTPRQNFHRMMRHESPQWLPLDISATPPIEDLVEKKFGTRNTAEAFKADIRYIWAGPKDDSKLWRAAFGKLGIDIPANAELWGFGQGALVPPMESVGKAYHLREKFYPCGQIADLKTFTTALPWPKLDDPACWAHVPAAVKQVQDRGLVAAGALACTIFESAWYTRGMDTLFMDIAEGNPIGEWLLDYFTTRSVNFAAAYADAGVDVLDLGDDVGTQRGMMMAPDFWRKHLKWRLKRVIDSARSHEKRPIYVKYHSDGDVREILGDLVEIGVDLLNPVQPECMPAAEIIPPWQNRLGFWGLVGTQTTMPYGTPDDVRRVVAEAADYARGGVSIVLAPTHVLEPDVPWENIVALVDAVRSTKL